MQLLAGEAGMLWHENVREHRRPHGEADVSGGAAAAVDAPPPPVPPLVAAAQAVTAPKTANIEKNRSAFITSLLGGRDQLSVI